MVAMSDGVELVRHAGLSASGSRFSCRARKHPARPPAVCQSVLDCHPYHGKMTCFRYTAGSSTCTSISMIAVSSPPALMSGVPGAALVARFLRAEYSETEISDCVAVIDWLARQPWSNGSVGMWGISWSAHQHAAGGSPAKPEALKGVHRADPPVRRALRPRDIHYIDGLLHYDLYELSIDLLNATITPGPDFALDEELLADRFDQPPWMATVLQRHPNDGYWRNRSLAPRYDRIACPVFLVGGWYDGYHECVFQLLDALKVPVQACVGPWTHVLPNMGGPGDPIDWLSAGRRLVGPLAARRPPLAGPQTRQPDRRVQLYARGWHPPVSEPAALTGSWRTITEWPVPGMKTSASRSAAGSCGQTPATAM